MSNQDFTVGVDEIVGAAINDLLSGDAPENQLAALMSGDDEIGDDIIGIDEIIGAAIRKGKAGKALSKLAMLKAAGQRGVVSKGADSLKWELLPIPLTTLLAGATQQLTVSPIRSQRLDQIEFPSSNVDHAFISIVSIQILGVEQLNGTGGVRLSQLSELRTNNILRGSTAQRSDNIIMTFVNTDTVNARTLFGTIGGPTLRVNG